MWIEHIRLVRKDGSVSNYPVAVRYCNGRRFKTYLGKKYAAQFPYAPRSRTDRRPPPTPRMPRGRPPAMNPLLRDLLVMAGYSIQGARIKRNKQTYLTAECATVRFSLLCDEHKLLIGSPENLIRVETEARRILCRAKWTRAGLNYEEAFRRALEGHMENIPA